MVSVLAFQGRTPFSCLLTLINKTVSHLREPCKTTLALRSKKLIRVEPERAVHMGPILALDLSSQTGWALLQPPPGGTKTIPALLGYGEVDFGRETLLALDYPRNYIEFAKGNAQTLVKTLSTHPVLGSRLSKYRTPGPPRDKLTIVIEETNKGKNRYTQKYLEFLHFAVLEKLLGGSLVPMAAIEGIKYIDSSAWRRIVGVRLSPEDKKSNKAKSAPKVTLKHVSVRYCNSTYHLELRLKDNNAADAICLGTSFALGAKANVKNSLC